MSKDECGQARYNQQAHDQDQTRTITRSKIIFDFLASACFNPLIYSA
jgi:hypothetical protein